MKYKSAIILLLLAVALFYTFTRVQYREVKELQTLSNEYQNVLGNVSDITELRNNIRTTYDTFPRADIDRLNKVLPNDVDTVRLALDLDGIASRYGISIKNIQAETEGGANANQIILPENVGVYDKALVSFSFVSNYENFMRFLSELERNLRIMDAVSVSFQTTESDLYEHQISVQTYWLNAPRAPSTLATTTVGDDLLRLHEDLKKVTLDRAPLASPGYIRLVDLSAVIPQQPTGRPNPFNAIGRD